MKKIMISKIFLRWDINVALACVLGQFRYPCPRKKEKPQQDGRRGKIMFRIKPHTHQRCSEGLSQPCVHLNTKTPTETKTKLC